MGCQAENHGHSQMNADRFDSAAVVFQVISRRRFLSSAIACAAALPLTGGAQQGPPNEIKVSVPGPGNSVSLPLELAVKIGADRAEGLSLRLKFGGGSGVAIYDLQSGDADFAVFGLPAAMAANLRQPTLVALAALGDLPLYTLMVRQDLRGKVRRIQDLKGRVIGVHSNALLNKTTSHQIADLVFRVHGIAADDVRYIAAGQSWETQSSAMISGAIDASFCDEPFGQRLAAEKLAFRLYTTGDPKDASQTPGAGFLRATLIARRDKVEADGAVAERMVRMSKRVLDWMAARKAEDIADAMALSGAERKAFIDIWRQYPRQYSRDAKFSSAQLRETDTFFRASNSSNADAQRFSVESMIVDKWAGRKP